MYELTGSIVNIAFYALAAVVIISAVIKIIKNKKTRTIIKRTEPLHISCDNL